MKIMLDTNILISAIAFPNPRMNSLFDKIYLRHELFLCSYTLVELARVISKKFPTMKHRTEEFLADAPYQFVFTPTVSLLKHEVKIRDKNDYPILPSAIISGMDILITGDKDFQDVVIDKPIILTPTEFLNEKY